MLLALAAGSSVTPTQWAGAALIVLGARDRELPRRVAAQGVDVMSPYALVAALATVALVIVGQTLLKRGMNAVGAIGRVRLRAPGRLVVEMASRWELWVGTVLYAASAVAWLLALSTASPSLAYPFLCLSYLGVAVTAVVVLGERLTPAQWLGVLLIIVGVAVVTLAG